MVKKIKSIKARKLFFGGNITILKGGVMRMRGSWMRLLFCAVMGFMMMSSGNQAWAVYPDRPITVWVSYAPGGSIDTVSRTICTIASKILGQPIVVENKAGGGGTVALALLANTKPDGYTLASATDSAIVRQPQFQKVTYTPLKSFTPLIAYAAVQNAITVRKDAPWKTLKELLDYAKANPGKIKYGTGGVGTGMHHAVVVLEHQTGAKMIHVPYTGNADALTALMGGHLDFASAGPEIYPFERSGALRLLAIAENKRHPAYPNVPTMTELGYEFANDALFAIVGPAGLPADVAKKVEDAFQKASESKEVKAVLSNLELRPVLYVGKDFEDRLKNYWPKMEKSLKDTGLIKEPATSPY
jgi:tripartite-type tricarboxylate transporter receptor subunit TctC